MDKFCVLRKNSESFGLTSAYSDTLDVQSQTRSMVISGNGVFALK